MLTAEETATLNRLTAEMKTLLDKAHSLSEADVTKVGDVLGDMESYFGGVPTLRPDIPDNVQKMLLALWNVFHAQEF